MDKIEAYYKEMSTTKKSLTEMEDEKRRLETEVNQVILYFQLHYNYLICHQNIIKMRSNTFKRKLYFTI